MRPAPKWSIARRCASTRRAVSRGAQSAILFLEAERALARGVADPELYRAALRADPANGRAQAQLEAAPAGDDGPRPCRDARRGGRARRLGDRARGPRLEHALRGAFTGVRVPVANTLGGEGEAFALAQKRLGPGRIHHAMRWLGQMQRAFELMCRYANEREAFGGPLADKQTVQNWVADSAAEIQACRLLTMDAARKIDEGSEARVEVSLLKFYAAHALGDVIDRAIQVHGARGLTDETPARRDGRTARGARIYDGPDEVHRMVVARRILRVVPRRATAGRSPSRGRERPAADRSVAPCAGRAASGSGTSSGSRPGCTTHAWPVSPEVSAVHAPSATSSAASSGNLARSSAP